MQSGVTPKSIAISFGVVVLLYAAVFLGIEAQRHTSGPWVVQFVAGPQGQPSIQISQEKLRISDCRIVFSESTAPVSNLNVTVVFDQPMRPIPFGQRLHEDLVSLPGVETLDLFGHQIELFPRSLRINGQEHSWQSSAVYTLAPPSVDPRRSATNSHPAASDSVKRE